VAILVRDTSRAAGRAPATALVTASFDAFVGARPDVVVEMAGHGAVRDYGERALAAGADLVLLSVGALADEALADRLIDAARRSGRRILVPSGAIAGLDAIGAAALADVDEVTHTVRKPPRAFTAEQLHGPVPVSEARLLYEGPARTGATLFPENVNVAAAVSLAGIGLDRTILRVYADPSVTRNVHEVRLRGEVGEVEVTIRNEPSENPKTGRIVALSVVRALRDLAAPLVVG
jgi:aspartate dehydrogenase